MTAKKYAILRSDEEWLQLIECWKSSQKSIKCWCRENQIPNSSFHDAYYRLLPQEKSFNKSLPLQRSSFKELNDTNSFNDGLEFTFRGITLMLGKNFDESFLLKLLKFLENS